MPGKVIAGHAKYEQECANCHVKFDKAAQDGLCLDCHKEVARDVRAKQGYHGRLKPEACRSCHTDHKGRDVNIVQLDEKAFDHAKTDFALAGAHPRVACRTCHVAGKKYREAPGACDGCHRKDDKHKGALGPKCADCHTETQLEGRALRPRQDALRADAASTPTSPARTATRTTSSRTRRRPASAAIARTTSSTAAGSARSARPATRAKDWRDVGGVPARPRHEVRAARQASRRRSARPATPRAGLHAKLPDDLHRLPQGRRQAQRDAGHRAAATATPSATGARRSTTTSCRSSSCAASIATSSARTAIATRRATRARRRPASPATARTTRTRTGTATSARPATPRRRGATSSSATTATRSTR